ncbi:MAG: DUF929 domain-containing protein [Candidatus Thermoplasmatota archaeon]|nr:DUF929 domain-containing protein [Candidatus Thermoplasmatota archaeon]
MANRKGKNRSDKRKIQPVQPKKGRRLLLVPVFVLLIVVVILASYEYGLFNPDNSSSAGIPLNIPSFLEPGYFAKISDSNVGSSGTVSVYLLSWYGCPIGAAESWIIYNFTRQYTQGTSYIRDENHTSDPNVAFPGTPGMIFNNYSMTYIGIHYSFNVAYVYGQYVNNTGSALIRSGLQIMNSSFPNSVSTIFYQFEMKVPLGTSNAAKPSAINEGHLTTAILVSGNNGTYIVEGSVFSPSSLQGYTPDQVRNAVDSGSSTFSSSIGTGTIYFEKVLSEAIA